MNNLNKIMKEYRINAMLEMLITVSVVSIICAYMIWDIYWGYNIREYFLDLSIVIVIILILAIIYLIISLAVKKNSLKKEIVRQGSLESFNNDYFEEVEHSKQFFLSKNWLVWHRGPIYMFFHKNSILSVKRHPQEREGNVYAVCDMRVNGKKKVMHLYYVHDEYDAVVESIQAWLHEDDEIQVVACPICSYTNDARSKYCANCGQLLYKQG